MSDEMSPSERRAVHRATQKEWDWDHPWCEVCEVQHLPDQHTDAWDAYHAALDAEEADEAIAHQGPPSPK